MKLKKSLKDFWNWLWKSDSWLSYIIFLILVFIVVKFIFLPGLGLLMRTTLPLAIVESSSMDHNSLPFSSGAGYEICGKTLNDKGFLDSNEYWNTCGSWYEQNTNITKAEFQTYKFKDGFRKGDLMIIIGKKPENIKIGDIIIFTALGRPNPIIHRVIFESPRLETKGDHNPTQLPDETNIQQSQIVGVAVARIPHVGWIKLFFVELFQKLF